MEDKRTEFLEVLNEVLKKVGLPSFYETAERRKVFGDNSHFAVFPLDSKAVGFEIVYSDEEGFWKILRVTKQFDIHDTWGYDSLLTKEAQDPPKLLEKVIELLRTRFQNPRVE